MNAIAIENPSVYVGSDPLSESESVTPRVTDASRLTFPWQMVVGAIMMTATILGGVYTMTSGLKESQQQTQSDMRVLKTQFEMRLEVDKANDRADSIERDAAKETMRTLRGSVQLLEMQVSEMNKKK